MIKKQNLNLKFIALKNNVISSIMKKNNKVLQPVRFVDAFYDFSPIQRDFIMMVQYKTNKQPSIKNDFEIDLKPYLKAKGLPIENVRSSHYKDLCNDLLSAKVGFQYFKGSTLYTYYNLFSRCSVDAELKLSVSIVDDVLPLFYINKLKEGHFKENKLVKELFEKSYPEYDNYVAYLPKTFIDFEESSTKKLFEKLLQYRKLKTHTYEFTKNELYHLLGYGHFIEKELVDGQQRIFDIAEYEFKQIKYKGVDGWKNLSKKLNKWLETISDHPDSSIKVVKKGKNYFKSFGRPIRTIKIEVLYDNANENLEMEQMEAFNYLEKYRLSEKQKYAIVKNFSYQEIKDIIDENVVALKDSNGKQYFGEYKRSDYRKIDNIAGFIYSIFFVKK